MRDDQRRRARDLLTKLEARVSALEPGAKTTEVGQALSELTVALDLGPPEDLINCPVCGASSARLATLCGTCWSRLTPPSAPHSTRDQRPL